jgi:dipeptidyl aminopeptidase/acylaminoacyl peptidase
MREPANRTRHRFPSVMRVALVLTITLLCDADRNKLQAAQLPNPQTETSSDVNDSTYQRPPKAITDILEVPPTPSVSLSPTREFFALIERSSYPPIEDVAAPMLKLAGSRINPVTNGPHLAPRTTGILLQSLATSEQRRVPTPANANLGFQGWSPDGKWIAFTVTGLDGITLQIVSVSDLSVRKFDVIRINGAFGVPIQWLPDSSGLLVQAIPANRGAAPEKPRAPKGPTIEESSGNAAPVRTYQDLLQSPHDENLFDYYCRSQLTKLSLTDSSVIAIGEPKVFANVDVAPDGVHVLVAWHKRPYSYTLPANRFPRSVEVWNLNGDVIYQVADLPLEDRIPIEGVPVGPRSVGWHPMKPATLFWLEALDDGDPKKKVPHRDRVVTTNAPFQQPPSELTKTEQRCMGMSFGEKDGLALIRDYDRDRRWVRTFRMNSEKPSESPVLVWERSINDRYADPGSPMTRPLPNGRRVLWQHQNFLFLESTGATPKGDRPFLDRYDMATGETKRLFVCDDASFESVVALLSDDGSSFITQHESPTQPPNFYLNTVGATPEQSTRKALTAFVDPMPQLRTIHKELVTYQRDDGVPLSFTLYLPPGHKKGERLPTIVWAYPREFNDAGTAGQVSGSTNRFTTIGGISHLFLLTQGYAILDEATMPVVGPPETANDTFITQVVSSAKAAIDKAVEMGVIDPDRVGVGGHSYGAFMTANLLAHSDLFRTGVARSGAYNRTLTPFGFQNERRTFWEAPQIYLTMSPFAAADKIKVPILLIPGADDNNPGTFPVQSERLYQAIRGNGGTVRYVSLPHESHGYVARESVEHTLWEMVTWFDLHVKNAPARSSE